MQTNDIVNKYYTQAQNNQRGSNQFLYNQKNNAITQAQNVLTQKYGNNASFDVNKSFYDYGTPTQGYNSSLDPELAARYNKAISDYQNYENAIAQANQLETQKEAANRQASLMYQQGQKYSPSQLQAMGLGNTGLSESTQAGLMNTYSNILANNNRDYISNMNQLYNNVANANRESNSNFNDEITKIRQELENKTENNKDEETNKFYTRFSTELASVYDEASLEAVKQKFTDLGYWNDDFESAYIAAKNALAYNNKQKLEADNANRNNEINNMLLSVGDKNSLALIERLYGSNFTPEQEVMFDFKENQFTEQEEIAKEELAKQELNRLYGVTDFDNYLDAATFTSSQIGIKNDGKQKKLNDLIHKYYKYIEGKVFDINRGGNTNKYVIYNGKLYSVPKDTPKDYSAIGLRDYLLGLEKKEKEKNKK